MKIFGICAQAGRGIFFSLTMRRRAGRPERAWAVWLPPGLFVEADIVASLEKSIAFICGRFGVPSKEEFKRSPGSTSWMRTNLVLGARKEFFLHVVQTCKDLEATAGVVISDETSRTPHSSTRIFLHQCLGAIQNGTAYGTP